MFDAFHLYTINDENDIEIPSIKNRALLRQLRVVVASKINHHNQIVIKGQVKRNSRNTASATTNR